jgi:hypothetical protein
MRLKKHQSITLAILFVMTLSFVGVIFAGVIVAAMASSDTSPYQVSFRDYQITATPYQPNSFANILEDGTIELTPNPFSPRRLCRLFRLANCPKTN